jgi:hypothetical protein
MNLRHFLACLFAIPTLAVLLQVIACDSGPESGCCPIDPPSCDGTRLGGSPDQNGRCAGAIADAPPPTFSSYIDGNGCPAYRVSGNGSCLTRDAGYDAGRDAQPDAPATDAQPDAPGDAATD